MNVRSVLRVARLDLILLWRNRTALFSVLGVPLFFGALLFTARDAEGTVAGTATAVYTGTGQVALFVVFSVFINLVGVFTARREEGTLKRLRAALPDAEILGGSALCATALYLFQAGALLVVVATALGGGAPADPVLLLVGVLLAAVVFALLALTFSGLTPTTELAQLTVLPVLFLCMAGSGAMFPLDDLPEGVRRIAGALPLTPVVEIVQTAYLGRDFTTGGDRAELGVPAAWAACAPALLVLAGWTVVGVLLARRWFRWEPRRG